MTKPVARSRILETMSTALLRSTRAAEPRDELTTPARSPVDDRHRTRLHRSPSSRCPQRQTSPRRPRGIALHEGVAGDVVRDHRTGGHEGELADGDARHDDRARADRRASPDVGRHEPGVDVAYLLPPSPERGERGTRSFVNTTAGPTNTSSPSVTLGQTLVPFFTVTRSRMTAPDST